MVASMQLCSFAQTTLPHSLSPRKRLCKRCAVALTGKPALPSNYKDLRDDAVAASKRALSAGRKLIEIQFPPVPNMATAALNQLLDANRAFTREFLRSFSPPRVPSDRLNVVFPDLGEARLAQKVWGDVPFSIRCMPENKRQGTPSYVLAPTNQQQLPSSSSPGLIVVVNPGFNISEWIHLELLEGQDPIIVINGDLDKVRGGYYPRIFYPGLHAVKDRFIHRFEPVYYIKQFSNGGTLFRRFDEDWILFHRGVATDKTTILRTFKERPKFTVVEELLREARYNML